MQLAAGNAGRTETLLLILRPKGEDVSPPLHGISFRRFSVTLFRKAIFAALIAAICHLVSCGGGPSNTKNPFPLSPIIVNLGPSMCTVNVGGTVQFYVAVTGDPTNAVTWAVNGTAGGSATAGTISATGLYTAPPAAPSPNPVTVTATSNADTTKSASATVTVQSLTSGLIATLSPYITTALQDGTPAEVNVALARSSGDSSAVTLTVPSLPAGVSAQIQSPGTGNSGTVTFTASQPATAGTYTVKIHAADATSTGSGTLTLIVGIVATISPTVNTNAGVNGRLEQFMTTSFQNYALAPNLTSALTALQPQHIRMQVLDNFIPQTSPTTWDFTNLDSMVQPLMGVADQSPEFQIAMGPSFMYDSTGTNFLDPTYQTFATFCKQLVEYYSNGQFTDEQGVLHQNPYFDPAHPIVWWGIYNEPNGIGQLTSAQYVNLYNVVVPAMQSANPHLKFAAVELADFPDSWEPWLTGQDAAHDYLPTFISNVNAQVDVLANHFYATWVQTDTDQTLLNTIPWIAQNTKDIYSMLEANPALKNVPVWMTENNVNADWDNGSGTFVLDHRGSSPFFAAWRPTEFSQLAQAGQRALYQWVFVGDAQYGEINQDSGNKQLSYWVDYWLGQSFPSPPGQNILTLNVTESTTVEVLAVQRDDGTVVIMVDDHAVRAPSDNNGTGAPRTVVLDLSALGSFSSASQVTIDANTNPISGPVGVPVTPAPRLTVTLNGYGVSFLTLTP
jgi:hypothetical protein